MKNKFLFFVFLLVLVTIIVPTKIYAASSPTYRALLIGNGNYGPYNSLSGPYNDVTKVENALRNNYFSKDNTTFSSITKRTDLTKNGMIYAIRDTFKDVKDGDISYVYFSGHGALDNYVSYIVGVEGQGLSVHELELELQKIPGTIVILLDSCHSGGFINKDFRINSSRNVDDAYIEDFNQSVINAFAQKKTKSYLTDSKYKVLTASSKYETSLEVGYTDGWGWGGEFTRSFVTGTGYSKKFLADNNYDNEITLDELFHYTDYQMFGSNVQVWPDKDKFIIGSDFGHENGQDSTIWNTFKNVDLNKKWNIEFNMALDNNSWKENVYVLDSKDNELPISVSKNSDGKSLTVTPLKKYDYNSKYTLVINDDISSNSGSKLVNKVYVPFITEEMAISDEDLCLFIVQYGHFLTHPYPSGTEEAFDDFFLYPIWEYFYSYDGYHVVEFNGIASSYGQPVIVTLQFTVDMENGSFTVNYAAIDDEPLYYNEFGRFLDIIYDSYFDLRNVTDIDEIFIEVDDSDLLDNRRD